MRLSQFTATAFGIAFSAAFAFAGKFTHANVAASMADEINLPKVP